MHSTSTPNRPRASARWRVPLLAWLPIGLAIVAESVSNALRAYGLGMHLDRFTVHVYERPVSLAGAVLVVAAVAISLSQARAAWVALTPSGPARQRIVAGLAALLLLAISVTAMASHILEAQRAKNGGEAGERDAYRIARADYDKAKADLDRLGPIRSTAEVRAAMDRARVPAWAWGETKECTAAGMTAEAAKACRPILDLRVEMAQAIAKADASAKLDQAKAKLGKLAPVDEASADEATVSRGWAWIMGLGVVFVATFGTVIFARVDDLSGASVALSAPARGSSGPSFGDQAQTSFGSSGAGELLQLAAIIRPDDSGPGGGSSGGPDNRPDVPIPGPAGRREAVLGELLTDLALGRSFASQTELCARHGVARSTMSDWLTEWEKAGLIPERRTVGRTKALAPST